MIIYLEIWLATKMELIAHETVAIYFVIIYPTAFITVLSGYMHRLYRGIIIVEVNAFMCIVVGSKC